MLSEQQVARMFMNLKASPEGPDLTEYLETLIEQNHQAWLNCEVQYNELHKGHAQCLDNLLTLLKECAQPAEPQAAKDFT